MGAKKKASICLPQPPEPCSLVTIRRRSNLKGTKHHPGVSSGAQNSQTKAATLTYQTVCSCRYANDEIKRCGMMCCVQRLKMGLFRPPETDPKSSRTKPNAGRRCTRTLYIGAESRNWVQNVHPRRNGIPTAEFKPRRLRGTLYHFPRTRAQISAAIRGTTCI